MTKKNPHIGSTFESWLDEAGIREEISLAATKVVIASRLADEMKNPRQEKQAIGRRRGHRNSKQF